MKEFINRVERYCPLAGKNIVIEKVTAGENHRRDTCLNSRDCGCSECKNPLADEKPFPYRIT